MGDSATSDPFNLTTAEAGRKGDCVCLERNGGFSRKKPWGKGSNGRGANGGNGRGKLT